MPSQKGLLSQIVKTFGAWSQFRVGVEKFAYNDWDNIQFILFSLLSSNASCGQSKKVLPIQGEIKGLALCLQCIVQK